MSVHPAEQVRRLDLCLYVAAGAPNSMAARANLSAALAELGVEAESVTVIDIFEEPERALADRVYMTPMVVRRAPAPTCRIVGNLSDRAALLHFLTL